MQASLLPPDSVDPQAGGADVVCRRTGLPTSRGDNGHHQSCVGSDSAKVRGPRPRDYLGRAPRSPRLTDAFEHLSATASRLRAGLRPA